MSKTSKVREFWKHNINPITGFVETSIGKNGNSSSYAIKAMKVYDKSKKTKYSN